MRKLIQLFVFCALFGFVANGASKEATEKAAAKTVVVLGDSIAAGYGVDPDEAFPALLEKKARAASYDVTVKNAGLSGDTTAGGLRRLKWVLKQKADYLLIELGGNDGLRGIDPAETEKNLQAIIDLARKESPGITIIIAGMQMPANMGEAYTKAYHETFIRVAQRNKCILIPFLLEGVGGVAELNQADRIHPTAKGHQIIAETAWKVIQPLLAKSSS